MSPRLGRRFIEEELRLERVVCFALQPDPYAFSDDATELLEAFEQGEVQVDLGLAIPESYIDEGVEGIAAYLVSTGVDGFFVQAAQPRFEKTDAGSMSFSWGVYRQRWFYAASFDGALRAAISWGAENRRNAKPKGKAA